MLRKLVKVKLLNVLLAGGTLGTLVSLSPCTFAQITPDNTLGAERSRLTPNVPTSQGLIDRLDGGAIRGSNLFHSFSEFNVGSGQRVYFANPTIIENIISRVTGNTRSGIDGTLGVLGNANLFLINPNGIVFGPNAQLDIRGSFVASTSDRILFPDGYAFSATTPDAPPLLAVNAPPGLSSWLPTSGTISSAGSLTTGQDLALAGADLNLQGQLQAGRSVSLIATNTFTARDSAVQPFIASAGNQLFIQGNQSIDITALNQPQSGLVSGGDMVLRSDQAVIGDTRFTSGGNFRVERLDGRLGSVVSIKDPVFEVAGDFSIADYTGASLQILAGGSVTIPGTITITAAGGPFNDSTVALSNGTSLVISGTSQPTLDIRAGTTQFFGTPATGSPTSASITLGDIVNNGGLVFLTNQFQSNPALTGDITVGSISTADSALSGAGGGSVVLDSRGKVTFAAIDTSGGDSNTLDIVGNAGNVTLLAKGDILMPSSSIIFAYGLVGGAITLQSNSAILQEEPPAGTDPIGIIDSWTLGSGIGGDITFSAPTVSLGGITVQSFLLGQGQSGKLLITADILSINQSTLLAATLGEGDAGKVIVNARSILLNNVLFGSATSSPVGGNAGDVEITTNTLEATNGAQVISFAQDVFGAGVIGNAGNVEVIATDSISLSGTDDQGGISGFVSNIQSGVVGNGGTISVEAGSLLLQGGAQLRTTTEGQGDAGRIVVNVRDLVLVDGAVLVPGQSEPTPSAIVSEVRPGATGNGNEISISTRQLQVQNGGFISASTQSTGDAGNIDINATESATFDGAPGAPFDPSGAFVGTLAGGTGNGGTLTITTPSLSVTNGAQLEALTENSANAGNIVLNIGDNLLLSGTDSGILANTADGSTGNGGSIFIDPDLVEVRDGARIAVDSQGTGTAGDVFLQAGSLVLDDNGFISAETVSNTGGNITLTVDDVIAMRRNSRISTSAGTTGAGGDGGNITIDTRFLVAAPTENSDITANAFTGQGGNVDITAEGIFGFRILSRSDLEAALGTSDPALLNPIFLPTSDITAISQVNPNLNGTVVVQAPDVDPNRGAVALPTAIVDASRLIARDCSAGSAIARSLGSLTITGQGGLPPSPTEQLRGDTPLIGWENPDGSTTQEQSAAVAPVPKQPVQLVEVQSLKKQPNGRVVLVAQTPAAVNQEYWQRPPICPPLPSTP